MSDHLKKHELKKIDQFVVVASRENRDESLKPKFPDYADEKTRERTFNRWPERCPIGAHELNHSGFFASTSNSDETKCHHCGVACDSWKPNSDPDTMHAQLNSDCAFILRKKGKKFIQKALLAQVCQVCEDQKDTRRRQKDSLSNLQIENNNYKLKISLLDATEESWRVECADLQTKIQDLNSKEQDLNDKVQLEQRAKEEAVAKNVELQARIDELEGASSLSSRNVALQTETSLNGSRSERADSGQRKADKFMLEHWNELKRSKDVILDLAAMCKQLRREKESDKANIQNLQRQLKDKSDIIKKLSNDMVPLQDSPHFVDTHDADSCSICGKVVCGAMQTTCGHLICKECVPAMFDGKQGPIQCPGNECDCLPQEKGDIKPCYSVRRRVRLRVLQERATESPERDQRNNAGDAYGDVISTCIEWGYRKSDIRIAINHFREHNVHKEFHAVDLVQILMKMHEEEID